MSVCVWEKSIELILYVGFFRLTTLLLIIGYAQVGGGSCKYALSVKDTFKLAAGEMNLWLLSC